MAKNLNLKSSLSAKSSSAHMKKKLRKQSKSQTRGRYTFNIPGVRKLILSEKSQTLLSCVVGKQITTENPWILIAKEVLEYDIDSRDDDSEFLPLKSEILAYPRDELLLGLVPEEGKDYDEFYICVTVKAKDAIMALQKKMKELHERQLESALVKMARPWNSYGSHAEVQCMAIRKSRPFVLVELDSAYPIVSGGAKHTFRIHLAKQSIREYTDFFPLRHGHENIFKRKTSKPIQATPILMSQQTQTRYSYPKHASTEYDFEYGSPKGFTEKNFQKFTSVYMEDFCEQLYTAAFIDFYRDDYERLVKNQNSRALKDRNFFKEYVSIMDFKNPIGSGVASIVWHPLWTGIVAIAYTNKPSSAYKLSRRHENDPVDYATYHVRPVLIWSFDDLSKPVLILEASIEITCLAFCPFDENILIGGCSSGQVVVWDLTDKFHQAENSDNLTPEQSKFRSHMFSFMTWMKNIKKTNVVRETAVSNLIHSHQGIVTSITWISPHWEITNCGRVNQIPEERTETSKQFVTSGRDGYILTWDLKAKRDDSIQQRKSSKRLKHKPSALTTDVSQYRDLHRQLRPIYILIIAVPNTSRKLPINGITFKRSVEIYKQCYPNSKCKLISGRISFGPKFIKAPPYPRIIYGGTIEGDYFAATWDGLDVASGAKVNKETCKLVYFGKYHDGPIVSITYSQHFQNLILTVGGKVFALWLSDYHQKPVVWRRSRMRYTHGTWFCLNPSRIRLAREDGHVEFWDFGVQSNTYELSPRLSSDLITLTIDNTLKEEQNFFAVGDTRGLCHIVLFSQKIAPLGYQHNGTFELCRKEVKRKTALQKWQEWWRNANREKLVVKQENELATLEEPDNGRREEKTTPEKKNDKTAQNQFNYKEILHMQNISLQIRGLNLELLKKQMEPLEKLNTKLERTNSRLRKHLERAQGNFQSTLSALFPEIKDPRSEIDTYAGGDVAYNVEIYRTYTEIEKTMDKYVETHPYVHHFNWFTVLCKGIKRRRIMDRWNCGYTHNLRMEVERKRTQGIHLKAVSRNVLNRSFHTLAEGRSVVVFEPLDDD